jgi:hypothetical protein
MITHDDIFDDLRLRMIETGKLAGSDPRKSKLQLLLRWHWRCTEMMRDGKMETEEAYALRAATIERGADDRRS